METPLCPNMDGNSSMPEAVTFVRAPCSRNTGQIPSKLGFDTKSILKLKGYVNRFRFADPNEDDN